MSNDNSPVKPPDADRVERLRSSLSRSIDVFIAMEKELTISEAVEALGKLHDQVGQLLIKQRGPLSRKDLTGRSLPSRRPKKKS